MNSEAANKFMSALVKALQTLCHGYVEFNDGVEIIGHIYLNIDSGSSFDYVVKEKLCKNTENSTVFVSKSFQAQAPPDECMSRKDRDDDQAAYEDPSNLSPTVGTSRLQSAITNISNVLSGSQDIQKPRLLDLSSHSSPQNTVKRKREHSGNYSSMQPPFKYTTLQSSSSSSSSAYFSSGQSSKQAADRNHFSGASHAAFFGADNNQNSGMGPEDEDDLHLDVTFVKEEYENQRNASQRGITVNAAAKLSQDLTSTQSNVLSDGTPAGSTIGYASSHHHLPQQFASGTAGEMGSLNQSFQNTSQVDLGQQTGQGPPNPRNKMAAGGPPTFQSTAAPIKYFRCPVCSIIIRHKNNVKRHMRRHNDPAAIGSVDESKAWSQHFVTAPAGTQFQGGRQVRSYNCPICGLLISHRKNVRRHMRKHTGELFFCDLCDWRGTCRWKLQKHREKKHGILPIIP